MEESTHAIPPTCLIEAPVWNEMDRVPLWPMCNVGVWRELDALLYAPFIADSMRPQLPISSSAMLNVTLTVLVASELVHLAFMGG